MSILETIGYAGQGLVAFLLLLFLVYVVFRVATIGVLHGLRTKLFGWKKERDDDREE